MENLILNNYAVGFICFILLILWRYIIIFDEALERLNMTLESKNMLSKMLKNCTDEREYYEYRKAHPVEIGALGIRVLI